ncbi:unnamed protein product, partial [Rotaria magnacalcarata]
MPSTRTNLNLTKTSIHDHLLTRNNEPDLKMNQYHEQNISEVTHSPLTSTNTSSQVNNTSMNNDDGQLLLKSSIDCQHSMVHENNNNDQKLTPTIVNNYQWNQVLDIPPFSGEITDDAGKWLDQVLAYIEQKRLSPSEQRDLAASKLGGAALLWYRINRLQIPDMQIFIHQFLMKYNSSQTSMSNINSTAKVIPDIDESHETTPVVTQTIQQHDNGFKLGTEINGNTEMLFKSESPLQVLQSAKNEKVKLLPNFSGSENSAHWIKHLEQTAKALRLNEKQIYELAIIKLTGPAQEWFYHQDDDIFSWTFFKEIFLHAFPPPIQPTNIDYLAQLLSRKQGDNEPVGKFVQDINRLCLKLDHKISEQDKLQFLRRGLRPQLQHHALSISSVQEFLTMMQQHEQIEKEKLTKYQSGFSFRSSPYLSSRPHQTHFNYQQENHSTHDISSDRRNP